MVDLFYLCSNYQVLGSYSLCTGNLRGQNPAFIPSVRAFTTLSHAHVCFPTAEWGNTHSIDTYTPIPPHGHGNNGIRK